MDCGGFRTSSWTSTDRCCSRFTPIKKIHEPLQRSSDLLIVCVGVVADRVAITLNDRCSPAHKPSNAVITIRLCVGVGRGCCFYAYCSLFTRTLALWSGMVFNSRFTFRCRRVCSSTVSHLRILGFRILVMPFFRLSRVATRVALPASC